MLTSNHKIFSSLIFNFFQSVSLLDWKSFFLSSFSNLNYQKHIFLLLRDSQVQGFSTFFDWKKIGGTLTWLKWQFVAPLVVKCSKFNIWRHPCVPRHPGWDPLQSSHYLKHKIKMAELASFFSQKLNNLQKITRP